MEKVWLITENHKLVFPERVLRLMEHRGKSREVNNKAMKLTKRQESILTGIILGDGFLQSTGTKNARLRLEHGGKQKEYLLWKAAQFPRLFLGKPSQLIRVHPKTKQSYEYWRHQSNSTPVLGEWRKRFYPEGKKHIPKDIAKSLNPLAIAVWYMDDGHYYPRDRASFIYLGRVSLEEANIAECAIQNNFGITAKIRDKKNKGFVLFFPVEETKKFQRLVKPFMLPLFDYKLSSL